MFLVSVALFSCLIFAGDVRCKEEIDLDDYPIPVVVNWLNRLCWHCPEPPAELDVLDQQSVLDSQLDDVNEHLKTEYRPEGPRIDSPPHPEESKLARRTGEMPSVRVGSVRGTPGVDYPNHSEIPITSFTCSDKGSIPGFYADLETDCQVFHVCYEHRRESFLCPPGTTFNQPILACDYWYSSQCSAAPVLYEADDAQGEADEVRVKDAHYPGYIKQFLPIKAKITLYPSSPEGRAKIVAEASVGKKPKKSKNRDVDDVGKALVMKAKVEELVRKFVNEAFAAALEAARSETVTASR